MGRWGGWGGFFLFGLYKGLHIAAFAALAGILLRAWWAIPAVAALWAGIERTHGYFGFAWLDLGNAGINMPLPMRLAPVTGVYGLSFVFAMLSCAVAAIVLRRPRRELAWLLMLVPLIALPRAPRPAPASQKALLVQPNIDTELNWTADALRGIEQKLALLSRASGVDIILWPEVPAPFYVNGRRHATARTAQLRGADGRRRQDGRSLRQNQSGSVRGIRSAAVRLGESHHPRSRRFRGGRSRGGVPRGRAQGRCVHLLRIRVSRSGAAVRSLGR
jgi:apolipoprotein N-acyltransferase